MNISIRKIVPISEANQNFSKVCRLAEKGAFGELTALYVRKSSAELNLGK